VSFESGQLVVDKRRHWRALSIALALNEAAEVIYEYIYGDKDAFLLAFRLAGDAYALVPHQPFRGDRCLFQRDFAGKVMFQHKTTGKWDYAADERPGENVQLFEESLAALATLRRRWNGRVFHAPDRSLEARAAEAELVATRYFRLDVAADDQRHDPHLELLSFGEIGEGRAPYRQNWWCETRGGETHLLIRDPDRISYNLTRQDDGTWRGSRFLHNVARVTLLSAGGQAREGHTGPGLADALLRAIGYPNHEPADWTRFQNAAALLAQVDPGFRARLGELGRTINAADLNDLAATLQPPERQLRSSEGVLRRHYRSTLDFDG
jgi:hypothetical protein